MKNYLLIFSLYALLFSCKSHDKPNEPVPLPSVTPIASPTPQPSIEPTPSPSVEPTPEPSIEPTPSPTPTYVAPVRPAPVLRPLPVGCNQTVGPVVADSLL